MTVPALIDVFPALSKAIASLAAGTATPGAGFAQLFATLLGTEKDGETLVEPDAKQPNTTGAEALAGAAAAVAAAPPITPAPETGPAAGGKAAGAPTSAPTSPSTAPVASAPGVEVGSAGVEVGSEGAVETAAPVPGAPPPEPVAAPLPAGGRTAQPKRLEPSALPTAATAEVPPQGESAAPSATAGTNPAAFGVTSAAVEPGRAAGEEPVPAGVTSTPAKHHTAGDGSRPVEAQAANAHVDKLALSGETAGSGDRARTGADEGKTSTHGAGDGPPGPRHDGTGTTTPVPFEAPVSREAARVDVPRDARPDVPLARDVDRLLGLEKARPLSVRDGGEMRLEVSPEGLGRIEMHVAVRADGVSASLYAAHDHARETLEAHRASLAAALGRSNLRLEGFTVGLGQERRDPEPRRDEARSSATAAAVSAISTPPAPLLDAGAPASGLSLRA